MGSQSARALQSVWVVSVSHAGGGVGASSSLQPPNCGVVESTVA
jgi:hypothetical protein